MISKSKFYGLLIAMTIIFVSSLPTHAQLVCAPDDLPCNLINIRANQNRLLERVRNYINELKTEAEELQARIQEDPDDLILQESLERLLVKVIEVTDKIEEESSFEEEPPSTP